MPFDVLRQRTVLHERADKVELVPKFQGPKEFQNIWMSGAAPYFRLSFELLRMLED